MDVHAPASSAVEMDLLGSLFVAITSLALVPTINNKRFNDTVLDNLFPAVPSTVSLPIQQQITAPSNSFKLNSDQILDTLLQGPQNLATEFGGGFYDATCMPSAETNPVADTGLNSVANRKSMGSSSAWMMRFPNFYIGGPGTDAGPTLRALGITFPRNDTSTGMSMTGAKDFAKTIPMADIGFDSDALNRKEKPSTSAVRHTATNGEGEGHARRHEPGWMLRLPDFYIGGPGSDAGPTLRALGITFPRNDGNTSMHITGASDCGKQPNAGGS